MGYSLGIDLGTTTCTVAWRRGPTVEGRPVGRGAVALPAAAMVAPGGELLVGEEADAACPREPTLVARDALVHLARGEPVELGGRPVDPVGVAAALLGVAAERAAPAPGARPDHVAVTFPLAPGTAAEDVMAQAAARAFGDAATLVPAPVAAAVRASSRFDLGDDALVAVVDAGGSAVHVTLVRRRPAAFALVGRPAWLPHLGGVDLDRAVLALVEGTVGPVLPPGEPGEDVALSAARRRSWAACRAAKERLSTDEATVVELPTPGLPGGVEITRAAFERTVEPALVEVADVVVATSDAAGLAPTDLTAVVLVGGSARTPRLGEVLARRLGRPVLLEDRPEQVVALGAALFTLVDDAAPAPATDLLPHSGGRPPGGTGAGSSVPEPSGGRRPRDRPPPADDPHDPHPEPADEATWGRTSPAEVRRLTTSDTDPFRPHPGRSAARWRNRRSARPGDDQDRPFDRRLAVGGALAAAVVVAAGGWLAVSGSGGSDAPGLVVAEPPLPTATSSSATTTPLTTGTTTTSTATSTTTAPRGRRTGATTGPTAPPATTPPPTAPRLPLGPSRTTTTTPRATTTTEGPDHPPPRRWPWPGGW